MVATRTGTRESEREGEREWLEVPIYAIIIVIVQNPPRVEDQGEREGKGNDKLVRKVNDN